MKQKSGYAYNESKQIEKQINRHIKLEKRYYLYYHNKFNNIVCRIVTSKDG